MLILANVLESNSEENDCKSPCVKESNTCLLFQSSLRNWNQATSYCNLNDN